MSRKRRTISEEFLGSDVLSSVSVPSRWLYVKLITAADDEGFISDPKRVLRESDVTDGELQELADAGLVLPFESGPVLLAHWFLVNLRRSDRYRETVLQKEKSLVLLGEDRIYHYKDKVPAAKASTRFVKPTLEEVKKYIQEKGCSVDADAWYAHYEANGWKVGKNKMKSWQAALSYWDRNAKKGGKPNVSIGRGAAQTSEGKWSTDDFVIHYGNEKPSG